MNPNEGTLLSRLAHVIDKGNGLAEVSAQATTYPVGVDISYWQGVIDFAVLADKVDFCIIRAGYGNDMFDPRIDEYRAGAMAEGIPFGLYWYIKPGKDWRKQAVNFYTAWADAGGTLPPVIDLEESGGLGKTALDSWCAHFYNKFGELSGLSLDQMMTYTSAGFLDRAIGQNGWLKHTQLFVAHWTTAPQPIIPIEWSKPNKTWVLWQHSSKGNGAEYGASSKYIDLIRRNEQIPDPEPPDGIVPLFMVKPLEDYAWVNLRAGAGMDYRDIGDILRGSALPVVEDLGEWYRVDGYVSKSVVKKV
jgi:lysozyme